MTRFVIKKIAVKVLARSLGWGLLGKPKGTIQKSKFDRHAEKIKELLEYGLSVRKISSVLEYTNHIALNTYINKRHLKEKLQ